VLGGALFLVLADLVARLSFLRIGTEPGVGVVTALVGAPFFLALLWRRRGERLFALLPLARVLGSAGCKGRAEKPAMDAGTPERVEVVDETGRKLSVPRVARRVVSLAPGTTEILFALGAGASVIGVDGFSDFPPEVKSLPSLGSTLEPNLERLISLKPDLVLVATTANRQDSVDRIQSLGIPVYATRSESLAALGGTIRQLGALVGRTAEGEALANGVRDRVEAVRERAKGKPRPRALVVVWNDPLITVGPKTLADELLAAAGGDNVCADADTTFPRYPVERVLKRAPEVIVVGTHAREAPVDYWRRWPTLPAVRSGRLHPMDGDLLFRPGPRVALGAEELFGRFHP
jgi:iron complex transport system substrate-binding protein